MMISVLLFLSSLIYSIDSCFPTSPIVMPAPAPTPPPIPPCQRCPYLRAGEPIMNMASLVNGCSVRTLTVMGLPGLGYPNGQITWNLVNVITVAAPGTATLVIECNAAGTAWEYMGTPVTVVTGNIF